MAERLTFVPENDPVVELAQTQSEITKMEIEKVSRNRLTWARWTTYATFAVSNVALSINQGYSRTLPEHSSLALSIVAASTFATSMVISTNRELKLHKRLEQASVYAESVKEYIYDQMGKKKYNDLEGLSVEDLVGDDGELVEINLNTNS